MEGQYVTSMFVSARNSVRLVTSIYFSIFAVAIAFVIFLPFFFTYFMPAYDFIFIGTSLSSLCSATGNDIRSAMSTLQFAAVRTRNAASKNKLKAGAVESRECSFS